MNFTAHIPFVELLGMRLTRFEGGQSTVLYEPRPEHLNSFGVTHGGAVMSLLDVTLAWAARSLEPEMGLLTIEMKTSFMRASPGDGSPLTAHGRVQHRSSKLAFCEGEIRDAQGQLCAHATGTFKYAHKRSTDPNVPTD